MQRADGKINIYSVLSIFFYILIPSAIVVSAIVNEGRRYYIISMGIIILSFVTFALGFEKKRPQAKELTVLAVLTALGVAGRVAFYMIPQFKASAAVIIITAAAFGSRSGFLCGATVGFISNFFFGQGPWTPWQMFAFGAVGFLAGVVFAPGRVKATRIGLCIYGFLSVFIVYGLIADTSSVFMFTQNITVKTVLATYASGVVFNLIHAGATVIFLAVLGMPLIKKLDRVCIKYGIDKQ